MAPKPRKAKTSEILADMRTNGDAFTYDEYAKRHNVTYNRVKAIFRAYKDVYKLSVRNNKSSFIKTPLRNQKIVDRKRDTKNVLVIGDLHEPFCLDGYLTFCKDLYKKYDCTHVVFIGDIIDNHFTSYHAIDPDGMSAKHEFEAAYDRVQAWVKAFPVADVCIGNHDRLVARKAFDGGIPSVWVRQYSDVLNAPGWDFKEQFVYDGVIYEHGEGGTARTKMKKTMASSVQGHLHTQGYCEHLVGETYHIFGMQVGCGVDRHSYAMAYARTGPKPVIGCGVVLNHGTLPINVLADLKDKMFQ